MTTLLHLIFFTLARATPLLWAAFGGLVSESSGVINFALEGMMLAGAFGAVLTTHLTGSPWAGLLGGGAGGLIIAFLHGMACLGFRANQIVSSIALNLLASGISGMLLNEVFKVYGTSPTVKRLPDLKQTLSPLFALESGWLSSSLGAVSIITPLTLLMCAAMIVFFKWSAWGLRIRACGENPLAANAAGLSVSGIRLASVLCSGFLAGLGGACLSIGDLSQFVENMTNGRGYLAVAALILGRWKPSLVLLTALLFGLSEALSQWLSVRWSDLPHQIFLALPYFICFGVLVFQVGAKNPPSALGR
jgi:simple sugar transport system permease protein